MTTRAEVRQAPLSKEFSRQAHWSGLPFPPPGGLPDPGIERGSLALQADSLPSESPGKSFGIHCLTILKSHNRDFTIVKDIGFTISTEHPSRFLLKLRNMTMAKQYCMSCGILVP